MDHPIAYFSQKLNAGQRNYSTIEKEAQALTLGVDAAKIAKIYTVRKSVACVLTFINQTQKENLRKFYRKKTHKPKDLGQKMTRAMRRALTPYELTCKSKKESRKQGLIQLENMP
ncbi:large ribosomal subunit protein uL29-like [Physella acuta]|uniref:large ribosomal subunit protein uL29-like n=1 Tax=Physella acuta TaxID=109671 RepID=UPI0027DE16F5|nr:large ribosomal subunit protein uL29-like [Physella acuta]